ncbi:MAG: LutB/LldF family L-lactate oxidation iron-sulfur protein [Bacteroidetes bacterium]|nr:LutB/LldF family L-lactate oxidation iron-sulfur protein [Bacteroidota bacterium]
MNTEIYNKFVKDSENKSFDKEHRRKLNFNISKYDTAVVKGKEQYKNLELAKRRAANLKHRVINNLDKYLVEFESNFTKRGGKVIWAMDGEQAMEEIVDILKKYDVKNLVKSKSMITEEIELNEVLKHNKIESLETDLGEYIVQIAGEKPYHIITPVMHKSKEDVAKLFNEKFNTPIDMTPTEIAGFVRKLLREKFVHADAGITGGNFLIADIGAVLLTENEGNGVMSVSFPKVHIAIVGIEKIIPSVQDLDLFLPLLATHGTGQNITVYNSILSGPQQEGEIDGPVDMYVVLLNNKRTEVLRHKEQRRALSCIRCGACLNGCPIYKSIGGHAYGTTYSGPIGAVISPLMNGFGDYKHLSFASSLCGMCTEVCPVKIPLHELLLENRKDSVKEVKPAMFEKLTMWGWKKVMLNRKFMDLGSVNLKNKALKMVFSKPWGPRREVPTLAKKSFHDLWKERRGN